MDDNIKTISTAAKRLGGDMGEVDGTLKPLLKCEYVMKALQNGSHINDLTWYSTGDKSNYNADGAIKLPVWHRCGISCCADGKDETPHYIVGDYDKCIQDTHGNKNFKAVMIRGGLIVTVPAYTTAVVYVTMASSLFKCGGETSSTWVGGIVSDSDSWKTVKDSNHNEWATRENSGVLPANDEDHFTIGQSNKQDWGTYYLGIVNYKADEIINETEQEVHQEAKPVYIVCTVEKASTINQRLMVVDNIPGLNNIDADVLFRARIIYTGEAVDTEEKHEYIFSYKRPTAVKFRKPERPGYQLGWLEEATGRCYPPTCYFGEQRGIKLKAQWTALSVAYDVEHYLQKTDGTYADKPDYVITARNLADADAFAPVKEYAGYGKPQWEPATVKGDGSTVIKCYYPILEFPIEFCANGGTFRDDGTDFRVSKAVYSKRLMVFPPDLNEREGYKFERWEPKIPDVMPAKKVTTRAVWTKLNNYYVEYEGEGATGGVMPRQTLELNQYQKLDANTYVRQYEVQFDIDAGEQISSKQAEYLFTGWAKVSGGPKVYDDEAIVRNLTNKAETTVTLYAAWKPQGVELPRPVREGFYFDGWYVDKECETRAEIVEGQYIPSENTTLYGQWISKVIPEIGWYQDEQEPVETRRIYAQWSKDSKIKSYVVHLFCDKDEVYFNANTLPDGAELLEQGGISVKTPEDDSDMVAVDMTEIFKANPNGGVYTFTVQPQIEGVVTDTIGSEDAKITTLAKPEKPGWKDDVIAVWKSVQNAKYYILQFLCETGKSVYEDQQIPFEKNLKENMSVINNEESKLKIWAEDGVEQSLDVTTLFSGLFVPVCYTVKAYNDEFYVPPYDPPAKSDFNG